ncbi:putative methyltransferase YcgJ [Calidithermus terrae]|uniref:Putative methyltransferase YcgJ n=1 Tax=Calidithermus terrae TaxID=1408545 RepID=A0A399E227_9DEIN|nr:class I SAM-dependent methyltransferase [Calidithermus terrae]RIH77469.1 putative methyltransferase YcgJ [Calidithermus terrae]
MGWQDLHRRILEQGGAMDWGAALTPGVLPYLEGRGRVLDLGCGQGHDSLRLARLGFHAVGLDLSGEALERARAAAREEGLGARFVQGDMSQGLPFPGGAFDAVLANLSLHYFDHATRRFVLAEVGRVLVAGGVLALHVNSSLEAERRRAEGAAMQELEPGFYLEEAGVQRCYFDREMLEEWLAGWEVLRLEPLEVLNASGKPKRCWRAVARPG